MGAQSAKEAANDGWQVSQAKKEPLNSAMKGGERGGGRPSCKHLCPPSLAGGRRRRGEL